MGKGQQRSRKKKGAFCLVGGTRRLDVKERVQPQTDSTGEEQVNCKEGHGKGSSARGWLARRARREAACPPSITSIVRRRACAH